jgi:hypothetical protein
MIHCISMQSRLAYTWSPAWMENRAQTAVTDNCHPPYLLQQTISLAFRHSFYPKKPDTPLCLCHILQVSSHKPLHCPQDRITSRHPSCVHTAKRATQGLTLEHQDVLRAETGVSVGALKVLFLACLLFLCLISQSNTTTWEWSLSAIHPI